MKNLIFAAMCAVCLATSTLAQTPVITFSDLKGIFGSALDKPVLLIDSVTRIHYVVSFTNGRFTVSRATSSDSAADAIFFQDARGIRHPLSISNGHLLIK